MNRRDFCLASTGCFIGATMLPALSSEEETCVWVKTHLIEPAGARYRLCNSDGDLIDQQLVFASNKFHNDVTTENVQKLFEKDIRVCAESARNMTPGNPRNIVVNLIVEANPPILGRPGKVHKVGIVSLAGPKPNSIVSISPAGKRPVKICTAGPKLNLV